MTGERPSLDLLKLLNATDSSGGLGNHFPKSPACFGAGLNIQCFSHLSSSVSRQQTGTDFEKCRIAHHRVGEKVDERCSDGRGGLLRSAVLDLLQVHEKKK